MRSLAVLFASGILALGAWLPVAAETRIACTMQYDPVCAVKGGAYATYGNGCVAASEGAVFQHQGECTAAELAGRQEGTYHPPAHCTAWNDGCNLCSRSADGNAFCTMRACLGEPRAGYCTAYGESQTGSAPANPNRPVAIADPNVSVDVSADAGAHGNVETGTGTDLSVEPNFFVRIWACITSWFGSLF